MQGTSLIVSVTLAQQNMAQIITQPDELRAPLKEKKVQCQRAALLRFTYIDPTGRGQIYDPESTWYLVHGRLKSAQL